MSFTWEKQASILLKVELIRKGITYEQLVEMLDHIGVKETVPSVKSKIYRGTFSFAFIIQCAAAIGLESIHFETIPKKNKSV